MDETLKWTHLNPDEIARLLGHEGIEVSVTVFELQFHQGQGPSSTSSPSTLLVYRSYWHSYTLFNPLSLRSFSASWNDSLAASNKQHFSSNGLNRLYGFIPKGDACLLVTLILPMQLLIVRVLPLL
jgi:hypothetical protein